MNTSIPPRLRAPAIFVSATLIALAIGGAAHGWNTVVDIVPIPLLVVIALYAWGARDCDGGAVIRHQLDERQEYQRLKVQALVGRVRSLAVAIA